VSSSFDRAGPPQGVGADQCCCGVGGAALRTHRDGDALGDRHGDAGVLAGRGREQRHRPHGQVRGVERDVGRTGGAEASVDRDRELVGAGEHDLVVQPDGLEDGREVVEAVAAQATHRQREVELRRRAHGDAVVRAGRGQDELQT
jgi:hypothetical protein